MAGGPLSAVPVLGTDTDLTLDFFNQYLAKNINYLVQAGANLAAASTMVPTNEFHIVTGVANIDTLNPAAPVVGQKVKFQFLSGSTVRHNGGGTGNIRFVDGQNRVMQAGAVLEFVYDGTYWWGITATSRIPITTSYDLTLAAQTDLLSAGGTGIAVPGYTIPANGGIRVTSFGDWKQQSGGNQSCPRFAFKLGSTTLLDSNVSVNASSSSATRYPWKMVCEIFNTAAGAQVVTMWGRLLGVLGAFGDAAFTTGVGRVSAEQLGSTSLAVQYDGNNVTAVDTTVSQALQLCCTLPTTTGTDLLFKGGYIEVLS